MVRLAFALVALCLCVETFAMTAQPTKLAVWKTGETILGEEFLAANESIVDYLGTLRRPTDLYGVVKYNCSVKSRRIRPSLVPLDTSKPSQWVEVRMVYELKDCTETP